MRMPGSLQVRLALSIGILLTLLWIGAASVTTVLLRHRLDEVFDSALQETAQRLLPLAVMEIVGREEEDDEGATQRLSAIREHDEYFTYVVRDDEGRILLQSHAADPAVFHVDTGPGFGTTATHRLYTEEALQGTVRITVAEPLDHRAAIARDIQMGLGTPLLAVVPVSLIAIVLAVRASIAPLRRFRERLEARTARDLSPVPAGDLPTEIVPIAATLNALLDRLKTAFDAERGFAANAAHELRTPLAGAIAQAQRLQAESGDQRARDRAAMIETTLKRLTRLAERLMQLARAEGGRIRLDRISDLRTVMRVVIDDIGGGTTGDRLRLRLPDRPVFSDVDPDAVGILCRNLVDNALRHGGTAAPVEVTLGTDGGLSVSNEGPVIPPEALARLTNRFERLKGDSDGSGLGLAIVAAIADRIGSPLVLESPRPGRQSGFEARIMIPIAGPRIG